MISFNRRWWLRTAGVALVVLGLVLAALVTYRNSARPDQPVVFSERTMLHELWETYKAEYLEADSGRTLDKQRSNITTSEGQSYTMLRAVWMDDKETFDQAWRFTRDNLKHPDSQLFSWLFGQRPDGSYGVLAEQGGVNTASDGDADIALALALASVRWNQGDYLGASRGIVADIWEREVVIIGDKPYLAANNLEKLDDTPIIINPSYLAPYSYKLFAAIDPAHDWEALVDSSYQLIEASLTDPLGGEVSAGIPPNWLEVDRITGRISRSSQPELDANYGYDALRLPWRLALDWQWFGDPRAKSTLEKMSWLGEQWQNTGQLKAIYNHQGQAQADYETPAIYGGSLGYFKVVEPEAAVSMYESKLKALYSADRKGWQQPLGYYDDNWAWFGIALYQDSLTHIGQDLISS